MYKPHKKSCKCREDQNTKSLNKEIIYEMFSNGFTRSEYYKNIQRKVITDILKIVDKNKDGNGTWDITISIPDIWQDILKYSKKLGLDIK